MSPRLPPRSPLESACVNTQSFKFQKNETEVRYSLLFSKACYGGAYDEILLALVSSFAGCLDFGGKAQTLLTSSRAVVLNHDTRHLVAR